MMIKTIITRGETDQVEGLRQVAASLTSLQLSSYADQLNDGNADGNDDNPPAIGNDDGNDGGDGNDDH